jgi:pilus assembly protein Flp/PilA
MANLTLIDERTANGARLRRRQRMSGEGKLQTRPRIGSILSDPAQPALTVRKKTSISPILGNQINLMKVPWNLSWFHGHGGFRPRKDQSSSATCTHGVPMTKLFARFVKDESGATAIEYGLIAAGISLAIIAAVNGLGTTLNTKFGDISTSIK